MEFLGLVLAMTCALLLIFSLKGIADRSTKNNLKVIISGLGPYMIGLLLLGVTIWTAAMQTVILFILFVGLVVHDKKLYKRREKS